VIVHSQGLKAAALERGAPPEGVFLVPEPISEIEEPPRLSPDMDFLTRRFGLSPDAVSFFVPQFVPEGAEQNFSLRSFCCWKASRWPPMGLPQISISCWERRRPRDGPSTNTQRGLGISPHIASGASARCPRNHAEPRNVMIATGEISRRTRHRTPAE